MKKDKIAIIGAGVGGLATAARLAHKGFEVEVFERLSECGGRAHIIEDKGFKFDTGPSFVMMPDFFKEVFDYCGVDIKDYLDFKTLGVSYKLFFPDGTELKVYRDSEKTKQEFEKIEPGSSEGFDKFIAASGKIYNAVKPLLYNYVGLKDLFRPDIWKLLPHLHIFQTYWTLAKKYFKTDKLRYVMTFEALFIGVSPFESPAFYSVISYTDHVEKIAHSMGGMYQIPKALEKLSLELGVKIHYNREVKNISKNNGSLTLDFSNGTVDKDRIVVNADYAYAQKELLKRTIPKYDYSCSVFLLYLGVKEKVKNLEHHNLFFAKDLKRNLNTVFKEKKFTDDFAFYIHVPTLTDPSLAPEGKDIVYILIPVANLDNNTEDIAQHENMLREVVFRETKRLTGVDLAAITEVEHKFYPQDFISRYNILYGATFGLAHTLMQSAFFRPANVDAKFKNLYYVGASTQPGGGLPPVIASSRIVADLIAGKN